MPPRRPLTAIALLVAALVAACGSTAPSSGTSSPAAPTASPAAESTGTTPGATPTPGEPTTAPAPTATPTEPAVTPVPSAPGSSGSPVASPGAGAADACAGNDAAREFYVHVALAVAWPVFCPPQAKGWILTTGSYRLANGGKMLIGYRGPGGATLALSEGSFCGDASGCVPAGTDAGDTDFGRLTGTFVTLDGGDHAIVVDRGANPSWLLVTHGLDDAATRALGAALVEVITQP